MKDNEHVLPLQKGRIYGPVKSRRLGASLGLNILPHACKVCSFNCIYCQYGRTLPENLVAECDTKFEFPSINDIEKSLLAALSSMKQEINYITFSGNGEPSLHPRFPEVVEAVRTIRDRYLPSAKLAILSNATTLGRMEIAHALKMLDLPIMKLDAGIEKIYNRINRPAEGVDFGRVVNSLIEFDHPHKNIQALIMGGDSLNLTPENLQAWALILKEVRPENTQIYSLDRPPALSGIGAVPLEKLREFAAEASHISGVNITAF